MTRTDLLAIANQIVKSPIDVYDDATGKATIYTGLYHKRPIGIFVSSHRIVAICYNKVMYFINQSSKRTQGSLTAFYNDRNCTTKVFLYPNSAYLYKDPTGCVSDTEEKKIAYETDYSNVIPIGL